MPALHSSSFQFLFRFPGELEYEWNRHHNFEWPFDDNNIDYCLEEERLSYINYYRSKLLSPPKKYSLLIFTRSSLSYHRTVHNYSFTMQLKQKSSTSSIDWSCDHINNSKEIFDNLIKFKTTKNCALLTG
jgi:hypothetical protein